MEGSSSSPAKFPPRENLQKSSNSTELVIFEAAGPYTDSKRFIVGDSLQHFESQYRGSLIRNTEQMKGSSSLLANLRIPVRETLQDISNSTEFVIPEAAGPSTASKRKKPKLNEVPPQPRIKHLSSWTPEEDEILRAAVARHHARNWKQIAAELPKRTDVQCLHRWQKVLNPVLVKGYWTKEEDDRMIELVGMFGVKRWAIIARSLPGRNGKQCRERWCNHLDPQIRKEAWTEAEDVALFLAHQRFGNKWADISKLLPGRSDNGVKNRWNTSVKKRVKELEECSKLWDLRDAHQALVPNVNEIHDEHLSAAEDSEILALDASEGQSRYIQDMDDSQNVEPNFLVVSPASRSLTFPCDYDVYRPKHTIRRSNSI